MHSRLALPIAFLLFTTAQVVECQSPSYRLVRVGIITSRARYHIGRDSVPAMFVIDDTAFSRNPCGHATLFILGPDTRVVGDNGARSDTSALAVGRRVSVFVTDSTIILDSCPPITSADKVLVR